MKTVLSAVSAIVLVAASAGCSSSSQSSPSASGAASSAAGSSSAQTEKTAINSCQKVLLTAEQVTAALGPKFGEPQPLVTGGVTLGCDYRTPGYEKGKGGFRISVAAAPLPGGKPVPDWKYPAQWTPPGGGSMGTAGAVLEVTVDNTLLRLSVNGSQLLAKNPGDKLLAPMESLAEQAIQNL